MPEAVARSAWGGSGRSSPAIGLIATVVTIAGLHLAREILIPLALAILLSFALSPLVGFHPEARARKAPAEHAGR